MLPVVHLHQLVQKANGGRGSSIAGVDRLTKRLQAWSRELLLFEFLEQVAEGVQVARRTRRAMQRALDASLHRPGKADLDGESDLQRAFVAT